MGTAFDNAVTVLRPDVDASENQIIHRNNFATTEEAMLNVIDPKNGKEIKIFVPKKRG